MNISVYVPDQLWHQFRRCYPGADVEMAFRQWMKDWVDDSTKRATERTVIAHSLVRGRR